MTEVGARITVTMSDETLAELMRFSEANTKTEAVKGVVSDLVDGLLQDGEASICGMVDLEILQGLRSRERERVSELFSALVYVETGRKDHIFAGELLGDLRRRCVTIPSADALIGGLCIRRSIPLLTSDKHFDHLPEIERAPTGDD